MTNKRHSHSGVALLVALAALAALSGCQGAASHVVLKSLKDPYFPERYDVDFTTCAFRSTDSRDLHIAARTHDLTDELRHGEYGQYLHIHMYWQPKPGKTYANSSTSNATLRYVVASHDGVAVYAGTGFVFPKPLRDGRLRVEIESARLLLESQTGELSDFLGQAALTGHLTAVNDAGTAAQIVRAMDLLQTD